MSGDEGFLRRWSRRKQAAVHADQADAATPTEPDAARTPATPGPPPEPMVDLSTLPPVESIGAETDIRGFLQKGVPLDLTRDALRRAWSEDPAIRDFIEVAENQWDFATGSDIPGFGALDPGMDVRGMVADIMGDIDERKAAPSGPPALAEAARPVEPAPALPGAPDAAADRENSTPDTVADAAPAAAGGGDAVQQLAESAAPRAQSGTRRHGSALPR